MWIFAEILDECTQFEAVDGKSGIGNPRCRRIQSQKDVNIGASTAGSTEVGDGTMPTRRK